MQTQQQTIPGYAREIERLYHDDTGATTKKLDDRVALRILDAVREQQGKPEADRLTDVEMGERFEVHSFTIWKIRHGDWTGGALWMQRMSEEAQARRGLLAKWDRTSHRYSKRRRNKGRIFHFFGPATCH